MQKRGRPKKNDGKNYRIELRMDEKSKEMIEYLVDKTGKSISNIVRESIRMSYNLEKFR